MGLARLGLEMTRFLSYRAVERAGLPFGDWRDRRKETKGQDGPLTGSDVARAGAARRAGRAATSVSGPSPLR